MKDVYLSYESAEGRSAGAVDAWIAQLRRALALRLGALRGAAPSVVTAVDGTVNDAVTLLQFLSPASRATCRRDRDAFLAATAARDRLFTIIVEPISSGEIAEAAHNGRYYELLAPTDLAASTERAADKRFWVMIDDLAHEIAAALDHAQRAANTAPSGTRIFLAETSDDMREARDRIRRELQRRDHEILPDGPLPETADAATQRIRDDLARSVLAINLIGEQYGAVPAGSAMSLIELQHRLALEQCARDPRFHHVVWIPPGLVATDARQEQFLRTLRQFTEVGSGTEVVQIPLEDFKTLVEDKLRPVAEEPRVSASRGAEPTVYLMFDRADRVRVAPLEEYVEQLGIHVIPSAFDGDQAALLHRHQDALRTCDAALIVYGSAGEPWVRIKQQDLLKAAGFGRARQLLAKAVYVCPEITESKKRFVARDMMVIKDLDSIIPGSLAPFLEKVRETFGEVSA